MRTFGCHRIEVVSDNFSSANFSSANFSSANFSSANFSSAKVEAHTVARVCNTVEPRKQSVALREGTVTGTYPSFA
jgi:hypothetical protein